MTVSLIAERYRNRPEKRREIRANVEAWRRLKAKALERQAQREESK